MNKKNILGIALSVLCLILLFGLGVYLRFDFCRNTSTDTLLESSSPFLVAETETETEVLRQTVSQIESTVDEQTDAALAAIEEARSGLPKHQLIFVGDSRTVGMGDAEEEIGDSCIYIGAVGEGYHWFTDFGMTQMEEAMKDYPDAPVVLNLGVNDLDMIDRYLELYRTFSDSYPDRSFYYMSVNPVTEKSAHVTNMEISAFNSRLRETFPEQYLDCNTYLMVQEFESADGVHYSEETYRMIHDYTVRKLQQ